MLASRRAELSWLSEAAQSLYSARNATEIAAAAIGAVGRRFELAFAGCEEIGLAGTDYTLHGSVSPVPLPTETPAYLHDHPMIGQVRAMPALSQVRAVVSRAAFERTDYFNGVARPMGFNDHVILCAQRRPSSVTVSLCRDKVFTTEECTWLRLFQAHLAAAWQRTAGLAAAATTTDLPPLRLSPALRPVNLSALHYSWLKLYFPEWSEVHRLPEKIRDWALEARRAMEGRAALPRVLTVEGNASALLLRYFPLPGSSGAELHLAIWRRAPVRTATGQLSEREREVWRWMAQGKRDTEIAIILGVSPKTVSKHVEHVLAKLRVANRTAAVRTQWAGAVE